MAIETKHLTSLVELAHRRHTPQGADLQRGLHLARLFEADPSVSIPFRSLAWHVITESHQAAGWPMPKGERFPACCGAAASTRHGSSLLTQEIVDQLDAVEGRNLLFGAIAASRAVFGDWGIFPVTGAFLVPLEESAGNRAPAGLYRDGVGVRWGSAGDLLDLFRAHSTPVELAGREVLIPRPELIAARTAECGRSPAELECLIFCGAAKAAADDNIWRDVVRIAPKLGARYTPLQAAYRLRIDRWLGIDIPVQKRAIFVLRDLLRGGRAA